MAGKVELDIQPTMLWTLAIFLELLAASCFLRMPYRKETRWRWRIGSAAVSGFLWCLLVFGVYLNASMCEFFGIYSDMLSLIHIYDLYIHALCLEIGQCCRCIRTDFIRKMCIRDRVNLQCWVKIKDDWRDNDFLLNNFGFQK